MSNPYPNLPDKFRPLVETYEKIRAGEDVCLVDVYRQTYLLAPDLLSALSEANGRIAELEGNLATMTARWDATARENSRLDAIVSELRAAIENAWLETDCECDATGERCPMCKLYDESTGEK